MINIKRFILVLMLILLSCSVLGGLEIGLKKKDYGPNQALQGDFNFSFTGQMDADTPVIVSINGIGFEESLRDFLGVSATEPSYSKIRNPVSRASMVFDKAGSNTSYGVDLTQGSPNVNNPDYINQLKFSITGSGTGSGSPSPMLPSIKLGDKLVWSYRGKIINPSNPIYIYPGVPYLSSFNKDGYADIIPREAFCERTTIRAAPKYKIITDVRKEKEGYELLAFILDEIEGETIPSTCDTATNLCCKIDGITSDSAQRSCVIDKSLDFDGERYLCIRTGSGTGDTDDTYYSIGKEIKDDKFAGYYVDYDGNVNPQTNTDYFIWYEYAKFETNLSGVVALNDFTDLIEDDYPSKGKLIPITITTKGKGKIELTDLLSNVKMVDSPSSSYTKFTQIAYVPAKVTYNAVKKQDLSSGFLADLRAPPFEGTYTLTVNIGSETKSKTINVVNEPFAWILWDPEIIGVNQEVIFNGSESYSQDATGIASYKWDFGNGKTGNGTIAKTKYNQTGEFIVKLTVTDSNGVEGTYQAVITVRSIIGDLGVALNATEITINQMRNYIANSEEYVKDSADLLGINTVLDNATTELSLLNINYRGALNMSNATREAELARISNSLYLLMDSIPKSFSADSFEFPSDISGAEDIPDVSKLGGITDGQLSKDDILNYQQNVGVHGEARIVHIIYISDKEEFLILIKKSIEGGDTKGMVYEAADSIKRVITKDYEAVVPNMIYRWPATIKEIAYIIEGDDVNSAIEQSRTFIVPSFAELKKAESEFLEYGFDCGNDACDFGEDRISCPGDCKPNYSIGFIIFLIVLTLVGIWYINFYRGRFSFKRFKYDIKRVGKEKEEGLFKSEKDIINLQNYINISLKKGLNNKQIMYALMQKGWTSKQIEEAFKRTKR